MLVLWPLNYLLKNKSLFAQIWLHLHHWMHCQLFPSLVIDRLAADAFACHAGSYLAHVLLDGNVSSNDQNWARKWVGGRVVVVLLMVRCLGHLALQWFSSIWTPSSEEASMLKFYCGWQWVPLEFRQKPEWARMIYRPLQLTAHSIVVDRSSLLYSGKVQPVYPTSRRKRILFSQ